MKEFRSSKRAKGGPKEGINKKKFFGKYYNCV